MIDHDVIEFQNAPKSLVWEGDSLVDWVHGGNKYHLDGRFEHSGIGIGYKFDAAQVSPNGMYKVVYERLGTKGLVLKGAEIVREIDRSYYCAEVYEYPLAIVELTTGRTGIIHCPNSYRTIEIEDIETGEKVGFNESRESIDFFQSRFQVTSNGTYILSAGWHWHPFGDVKLYNLTEGLVDSSIFDSNGFELPINGEVCSARFISESKMLVSLTNEPSLDDEQEEEVGLLSSLQVGVIDLDTLRLEKKVTLKSETGDLIPIDEDKAWSLFEYPKIIDLNTGLTLCDCKQIQTGKQNSSIIHYLDFVPVYAYDPANRRLAVKTDQGISVLTYYE